MRPENGERAEAKRSLPRIEDFREIALIA